MKVARFETDCDYPPCKRYTFDRGDPQASPGNFGSHAKDVVYSAKRMPFVASPYLSQAVLLEHVARMAFAKYSLHEDCARSETLLHRRYRSKELVLRAQSKQYGLQDRGRVSVLPAQCHMNHNSGANRAGLRVLCIQFAGTNPPRNQDCRVQRYLRNTICQSRHRILRPKSPIGLG